MPRRSTATSVDALLREAMDDAVQRAAREIARSIAGLAADELARQLEKSAARGAGRAAGAALRPGRRRPPRKEMTRWVADRRARRVPTFVIDLTGLKTKKQIVARYGHDAAFEKGRPAPRARG